MGLLLKSTRGSLSQLFMKSVEDRKSKIKRFSGRVELKKRGIDGAELVYVKS